MMFSAAAAPPPGRLQPKAYSQILSRLVTGARKNRFVAED